MQIGIDPGGTAVFSCYPLKRDLYGCWESAREQTLFYRVKRFWPDGTATHRYPYYREIHYLEMPEEFRSLTNEDNPVEVEIVPDENGNLWLGRCKYGTLEMCTSKPDTNFVYPWEDWTIRIPLPELETFKELTPNDGYIRVSFRILRD